MKSIGMYELIALFFAYIVLRDNLKYIIPPTRRYIRRLRRFLRRGDKYIYRIFMPHRCYDGEKMGGWLNWFRRAK